MAVGLVALSSVVDEVVGVPVEGLCASELQGRIRAVARQRDRLDGWLSVAAGQLSAATGGRVSTGEGGDRSVAGWLAEATRTSPGSAGSRVRTSTLLRDLPLVAQAVLDGVLTQARAAVLARLVGTIPLPHLQAVQQQLILVAVGRDPAALPGQPGIPAEWACATAAWTGPATRGRIEALLCDARISRVLLDQVGQVAGLETLRDTVTPAQRRALAARDGRCVARGCTRPPAMCDAHHLISLADDGPTVLAKHNLRPWYRRRHDPRGGTGSTCRHVYGRLRPDQLRPQRHRAGRRPAGQGLPGTG
jgi:hypothetical protein